jgi:class 3 adenylate cyclase/tetratricopeptide (TPR) repeat protein
MTKRLQRLVPKEFADRLRATRGQVEGERRIVTILFSDVKGSTAMAEDLDPEDVMEIMDGAFDVLIEPVYRHEGTLARLMGDAILAFFGAPIAHEDDAQRACLAALEIVEGARRYAARIERERGIRGFDVRVGINTGLVVVGEVGWDLRAEYTAMGDAVNLASRMEQAAPAGGVLISHDTYRQVRGLFEVQALEPVSVKGKREPVQVYLVERAKPRRFRSAGRGVEGLDTRMIGRQTEFEHLQTAYRESQSGKLCLVTITGEAGVGKSRLLLEFEDWLQSLGESISFFKGRAIQQMQSQPYALVRNLLVYRFQIKDSDPTAVMREKFERGIGDALGWDPDVEMRAHLIGHLLGFDLSSSPHLRQVQEDARQLRDRASIYLGQFFRATVARIATVLFLEDLHWADASSLILIDQLAMTLSDQPVFMVGLARPSLYERRPQPPGDQSWPWSPASRGGHSRLELRRLSLQQSGELVAEILQRVENIPDALCRLVVDRAEGNPLYVEELIKMLVEDGVIVRGDEHWRVETDRLTETRVPPSLVGVLQARLDGLPLAERTILQRGSVVGRTFWDDAVTRIGDSVRGEANQPVRPTLSSLEGREIVFRREASTFAGAQEYFFKHAVLRDVTYQNILRRVRRAYHALVAGWLIEQGRDRADEHTGLIADHLELAGETEQAVDYLGRAGRRAAARFANAEAADYFGRGLDLLDRVDWPPARILGERYDLLSGRERVNSLLGEREPQAADLAELRALAAETGDDRHPAEVALRDFVYHEAVSDYPAALGAAQEAVRLAERQGNHDQEIEGLVDWGIAQWRQGEFVVARSCLEQALALEREHNNLPLRAEALLNLGAVAFFSADPAGARDLWQQALEIRRDLGDRRGEALCLNNLVAVQHDLGDLDSARTSSTEALAIYQAIGDRQGEARALCNLGGMSAGLGDLSTAHDHYEHALDLNRTIGDRGLEALSLKNLGLTLHELGDSHTAKRYCQQALAIECEIGDRIGQGYTLTYLALALEELGELDAAADSYSRARDLRREVGQEALAIDDLAGLAWVALKQERLTEALTYAEEALAWMAEQGVDGIEYPLRIYLIAADVLASAGHGERVPGILSAAHDLLQARAGRISDEATRQAFMEQVPLHRELLGRTRAG